VADVDISISPVNREISAGNRKVAAGVRQVADGDALISAGYRSIDGGNRPFHGVDRGRSGGSVHDAAGSVASAGGNRHVAVAIPAKTVVDISIGAGYRADFRGLSPINGGELSVAGVSLHVDPGDLCANPGNVEIRDVMDGPGRVVHRLHCAA
jgi:hypothetical protein